MPNINETARRWELDLAGRVGESVSRRRKALGLTAVQLAERTADLGYPITRVAVSKIENNARAGKLDVAELLVLAVALEVPPALLLFPGYPEGAVDVLPHKSADAEAAVGWLSGARKGWQIAPDSAATGLVEDVTRRRELRHQLFLAKIDADVPDVSEETDDERAERTAWTATKRQVVKELGAELAATEERIKSTKSQLWEGTDG